MKRNKVKKSRAEKAATGTPKKSKKARTRELLKLKKAE